MWLWWLLWLLWLPWSFSVVVVIVLIAVPAAAIAIRVESTYIHSRAYISFVHNGCCMVLVLLSMTQPECAWKPSSMPSPSCLTALKFYWPSSRPSPLCPYPRCKHPSLLFAAVLDRCLDFVRCAISPFSSSFFLFFQLVRISALESTRLEPQ